MQAGGLMTAKAFGPVPSTACRPLRPVFSLWAIRSPNLAESAFRQIEWGERLHPISRPQCGDAYRAVAGGRALDELGGARTMMVAERSHRRGEKR